MDGQLSYLESLVQQIGESVVATSETVDCLAERIDALAGQVQQQAQQIQQQGYQMFALSDAVQTLTETQYQSLERLNQVTVVLERLMDALELADAPDE